MGGPTQQVDELMKMLESSNIGERMMAIELLGEVGDQRALKAYVYEWLWSTRS